jgi:hypothetical protein
MAHNFVLSFVLLAVAIAGTGAVTPRQLFLVSRRP